MDNGYIALIDSGLGGLSVLNDIEKKIRGERFLYFGDNENAPYGEKTKRELLSLTIENITYIKSFGIKALVTACNTISSNLLVEIADFAEVPIFGVFPPTELCEMSNEKTLLLATPLTARKFASKKNLTVLELKNLAGEIERNANDISKVNVKNEIDEAFEACGINQNSRSYSTLILGCTHYLFVKNEIINHLKPQKTISGNEFTVNKLSKFVNSEKTLVKINENQIKFIGKNAAFNEYFYKKIIRKA